MFFTIFYPKCHIIFRIIVLVRIPDFTECHQLFTFIEKIQFSLLVNTAYLNQIYLQQIIQPLTHLLIIVRVSRGKGNWHITNHNIEWSHFVIILLYYDANAAITQERYSIVFCTYVDTTSNRYKSCIPDKSLIMWAWVRS